MKVKLRKELQKIHKLSNSQEEVISEVYFKMKKNNLSKEFLERIQKQKRESLKKWQNRSEFGDGHMAQKLNSEIIVIEKVLERFS